MKKCLLVFGLFLFGSQFQLHAEDRSQESEEISNVTDTAGEGDEALLSDEVATDELSPADAEESADDDLVFRKFVSIPSGYVYRPALGTTHDYCSYSPDKYGKADFRGPCARHDMCYDSSTDKKKCDANLIKDMYSNCNSAYGALNPIRATCWGVANNYFAAVVIHH